MSSNKINIEVNGQSQEANPGQMLIEVTDKMGIPIPRFCYHKKLSIAANCRMCLVDVEKAPKPLPACATPVMEGMKVFTTTPRAVDAQKAVMEFLLINHPLDCPICDQGGQCELQDVALEYGKDCSRYTEGKRVVKDKNIGPLISTEMTRCIHCTRCVRFGEEIAGVRELGATGRGECTEIGTYIEKSVNSELSGNVIDLCPVGALTSKPFRFEARAWELKAFPSISAHDCVGSNVFFHTLRGKVMRTLPRENEALNEVWLSDRDRFSYEGLNHADRLQAPQIKENGEWRTVDWTVALHVAGEKIKHVMQQHGADQLGGIASPNSTVEELYLFQKLLRSMGCHNIDHRLKHIDNAHQALQGTYPRLGITLEALQNQKNILLIGSDIHKEQPLIAHRVRKAALQGAQVFAVNPWHVDFNFPNAHALVPEKGDLLKPLLEIIKALTQQSVRQMPAVPSGWEAELVDIMPSKAAQQAAVALLNSPKGSVILGAYAISHPEASKIYALSRYIAEILDLTWGEMSLGANSAGAWLAGAVPHRLPMGEVGETGLSAYEMWHQPRKGYVLLNCEPELDSASPRFAKEALQQADIVIAITAFDNPHVREYADVLLPVTPISEMSGTYVNAMGEWQHFQAAVNPLGQSRPAWKVLRVLGNILDVCGFDFNDGAGILAELRQIGTDKYHEDKLSTLPSIKSQRTMHTPQQLMRLAPTPLYAVDGITRRAAALQQTLDAQTACIRMHSEEAKARALQADQALFVIQDGMKTPKALPIQIDDRIPRGLALVAGSIPETCTLGEPFGMIELVS